MAMGAQARAFVKVPDQPVRHLVGHHLDEECLTVLGEKLGIEAQTAAAEMRLAGALATQVEPHLWPRKGRMDLPTQLPGGLDPPMKTRLERSGVQRL